MQIDKKNTPRSVHKTWEVPTNLHWTHNVLFVLQSDLDLGGINIPRWAISHAKLLIIDYIAPSL